MEQNAMIGSEFYVGSFDYHMLSFHCVRRTKIFIRFPETLFNTEDLYQQRKHELGE